LILKVFSAESLWGRINFHSNLTLFKADGSITITGKKMAVKTVDRTFLQGQQSVDLFRAAIKSQATRDPYERRLGFIM
jgi:hypothetical protein